MNRFKKAILIIHGFAGGTYDQEDLATSLETKGGFDVYSFTLPGHEVKDKTKSTAKMWIKESERQLQLLIDSGYKSIYLIGHSMGGVIASHLAATHKEVKKLVLGAPAFSCLASKGEGGLLNIIKNSSQIIKDFDLKEVISRAKKLPISAVKEFFDLVEQYKDSIYKVEVPVLIIHGKHDNVVPISMSKNIFKNMKNNKKILIVVEDYNHALFRSKEKQDLINNEVRKFLKTNKFLIKDVEKRL